MNDEQKVKLTVNDVSFENSTRSIDIILSEEGGGDIYYNCFRSCVAAGGNPEKCWKYCYQGTLKP